MRHSKEAIRLANTPTFGGMVIDWSSNGIIFLSYEDLGPLSHNPTRELYHNWDGRWGCCSQCINPFRGHTTACPYLRWTRKPVPWCFYEQEANGHNVLPLTLRSVNFPVTSVLVVVIIGLDCPCLVFGHFWSTSGVVFTSTHANRLLDIHHETNLPNLPRYMVSCNCISSHH